MATLEEVNAKLDTALELLGELTDMVNALKSAPPTTEVGQLGKAIEAVMRKNPTVWFQPKDIVLHGVHEKPQRIGSACSTLVARGIAEVCLKSDLTKIPAGKYDYDPKMYRLKES